MKDIELLQYVHETAEMGTLGLQDIVGQVQTAKLKKSLQGQIAEYQTIASEAAKQFVDWCLRSEERHV